MNRKGFTLIELLAVIIIIALIATIAAPSVIEYINNAKNTSYNILIKNIVTASKIYYEECEYGDLSDKTKYGDYACTIDRNKINTTLGALANTGMLSVKDVDSNDKKVVLDPRDTKNDMSSCNITIKKEVSSAYKVTYTIKSSNCSDIQGSIN